MRELKCHSCGEVNHTKISQYQYKESGLDNVVLMGVEVYECSCGNKFAFIPRILELHDLIANDIIQKQSLLTGKEIRFLRKNLGLKAKDFAQYLLVTDVTVSRWETGKELPAPPHDILIRLFYAEMKGLDREILKTTLDKLKEIEDINKIVREVPYFIAADKLRELSFQRVT